MLAISLFRAEGECIFLSGLLTLHFFLKAGDEHILSVDVFQRLVFRCGIHYFSVYCKFVGKCHYVIFLNFHIVLCAEIYI